MAASGQGLSILYFHRVGVYLAQGTRLPPTHCPGLQLAGSARPVRSSKAAGLGPSAAPCSLTSCPFFGSQPGYPFLKGAPRPLGLVIILQVRVSDYKVHPFLDHTCSYV